MFIKSKIFPVVAFFALLTGLSACSTSQGIQVADNLGATTGLSDVSLRVEDLSSSHRKMRNRFGALETLYVDLTKAHADQTNTVDEVKRLLKENDTLKRDLIDVRTRLQRSEVVSTGLSARIKALETSMKDVAQNSGSSSTQNRREMVSNKSTADTPLYAVHLASFREKSQINSGWVSLRKKFPQTLGGLSAKVETSNLPQLGSFLRLLVGPFASLAEAKSLCDSLQLQNQYCKPTPFKGENMQK